MGREEGRGLEIGEYQHLRFGQRKRDGENIVRESRRGGVL